MKIDVWADLVCPFCYLGKRQLDLALEGFEHADQVEVVWHSFELDPTIARDPKGTVAETMAAQHHLSLEQSQRNQVAVAEQATAIGLEFNWKIARYGNTFDAHRLVHLAAEHGLGGAAVTALMHAYFTQGVSLGDREALQRVGESIGLPADAVRDLLAGDACADAVRADEQQAREIGVPGVPFFVFDEKYAASGAQPAAQLRTALEQVWAEAH